jgi:23S rRNA (uracil1939-C5)-methyltransferase
VIGIESVLQAVENGNENAQLNGIENVSFIHAPVEKAIESLDGIDGVNGIDEIDVAFLNPPRKGCEPSVIKTVGKLSPRRIIYLSCHPPHLGRDALLLEQEGYKLVQAQPVDMFPQTTHVETVAIFEKL